MTMTIISLVSSSVRRWKSALTLVAAMALLGAVPTFAQTEPASSGSRPSGAAAEAADSKDVFVASAPMEFETEGAGVFGQLVVGAEILTTDSPSELVYTITDEPKSGRVGIASGGEDADFFHNRTSRLGYFAYRPQEDYVGEDSFGYTVRNETSGLVFKNRVVIKVKPRPAIELQKVEVNVDRDRSQNVTPVSVTTRPNSQVTQRLPNHEDFMKPEVRVLIENARIAYQLDDKSKPQHGSATLDRVTGQMTYSPDPGFIGTDSFKYYTFDENNPHVGMENVVTVHVDPIRLPKHMVADRSKSRELDLVFVINNSPSMAGHQARIAANLSRFRQLFDTRDLDYRIGVLTTDFVNVDPMRRSNEQAYYKQVRSVQIDKDGKVVLDSRNRPKHVFKRVASNGSLVTLPVMEQPWVTRGTPDGIFAELVKVGTNGDSNRTAFTAVYNFVAGYYNKQNSFLRPEATTYVVFFMDEEETRMATWKIRRDGTRQAEWIENGKLPDLIKQANARNPSARQTLDGYINYWVLRPFIIAKGNKRGKIEMHAVVAPDNISHRRAAELTGGAVLNIEEDFSGPLAALGDRIADTVAVALDPVTPGATLYRKSLRVLVDGKDVPPDPKNGYTYDERAHSIRFHGDAKKAAFTAMIDITYEEHM